ncbi:MAG: hypothetical protein R2761_22525 [Acidimicrobiales bacterium]
MTPTQIALVTATWRRCHDRRPLVHDAVAATLPAVDGEERAARAARILDAVDRLHPLLAHPAELERETGALIGDWAQWTLDRRAETEAALLHGLTTALGPLPAETGAAWRAALDLFHEILAQLVLRPFGPAAAGPPGLERHRPPEARP